MGLFSFTKDMSCACEIVTHKNMLSGNSKTLRTSRFLWFSSTLMYIHVFDIVWRTILDKNMGKSTFHRSWWEKKRSSVNQQGLRKSHKFENASHSWWKAISTTRALHSTRASHSSHSRHSWWNNYFLFIVKKNW